MYWVIYVKINTKQIKSLFDYKDGNLYWKVRLAKRIQIGDKAGSLDKQNKRYNVGINNKSYKLHQLIFLYHYGYIPKQIDHIDRNSMNNRVENLRSVTYQQNNWNSGASKNSSSQYKGVSWDKQTQKWRSVIIINSKFKNLGRFKNETEAALAYNDAVIKYHGEYGYLNKVNL